MDDKTKKIFQKDFSILETKNSLLKEPEDLKANSETLGIGLPDIYCQIEKERVSSLKFEDIQHRIDVLKSQENVDPEQIELLEEMKRASHLHNRADSNPTAEINGFKNVQDTVRAELESIGNMAGQSLSTESILTVKKQLDSDPLMFRSKYPELFEYITSNTR
jgi:hypothetical protein